MATIVSIVYKPENTPDPEDTFNRVPLEQANLIAGCGIEGDRKGSNPERQLNIMSRETLTELEGKGFQVQPGKMGEQIIVSGLDIEALTAGERVQFGEQAVIEVIRHRTGCDRFEKFQGKSRTLAAGQLGVIAKVITGGEIRVGDAIRVVENV